MPQMRVSGYVEEDVSIDTYIDPKDYLGSCSEGELREIFEILSRQFDETFSTAGFEFACTVNFLNSKFNYIQRVLMRERLSRRGLENLKGILEGN